MNWSKRPVVIQTSMCLSLSWCYQMLQTTAACTLWMAQGNAPWLSKKFLEMFILISCKSKGHLQQYFQTTDWSYHLEWWLIFVKVWNSDEKGLYLPIENSPWVDFWRCFFPPLTYKGWVCFRDKVAFRTENINRADIVKTATTTTHFNYNCQNSATYYYGWFLGPGKKSCF